MSLNHEKLDVYRASIEFVAWCTALLEGLAAPAQRSVFKQLERASTSIALNVAEGNGKRSPRDRCRYLDIARGSALESAAALDVLVAQGLVRPEAIAQGKRLLVRIVGMLSKMTRILVGSLQPAQGRELGGEGEHARDHDHDYDYDYDHDHAHEHEHAQEQGAPVDSGASR